jgi:hypothetical protein
VCSLVPGWNVLAHTSEGHADPKSKFIFRAPKGQRELTRHFNAPRESG